METNIIYVHGCFECPYLNQTKDKEAFHKAEDKYYELMVKDLKLKEHHADVSRINAEIGDE